MRSFSVMMFEIHPRRIRSTNALQACICRWSALRFTFILFLAISLNLSHLGNCSSAVFSICWVLNTSFSAKSQDVEVWLDRNNLTSLGTGGKFVSLSATPLEMRTLRAEHEGISRVWNFSIVSDSIKISSEHKTTSLPSSRTMEALLTFQPNEVFACENDTLYLIQKQDFIIALGHTYRFPLRVEARGATTLLVSWIGSPSAGTDPQHSVTLYRSDPDGLLVLCNDTTHTARHSFSGLEPCGAYTACVETMGSPILLCLSAFTDPDVPRKFGVTAWDSSSLTLGWDCPSGDLCLGLSYLVTVFHVNGSGYVLEERSYKQGLDTRVFTVGGLPPCSMVKVGLQAMCTNHGPDRYSDMLLSDGNSANSEILDFRQSSFGPHSYTVSWSVRNVSSISCFLVYHQGEPWGSTLLSWHTVDGLLPCQQYSCQVEAVCGDSTVMSVATVHTKTGPPEVSDLRFRREDSTALWGGRSSAGVAFLYRLCESDGPIVDEGRLADSALPLLGLRPGTAYDLEVVPVCEGGERGTPALLYFVTDEVPGSAPNDAPGEESSSTFSGDLLPRAPPSPAQILHRPAEGLQVHDPKHEMSLIVPWTMPLWLHNPKAEPQDDLERIIERKLQNLLKTFWPTIAVQLISFEDFEKKTKITFMSFISSRDGIVSLPSEQQLHYIASLNHPNVTVTENTLHWNDPDECSSSAQDQCGSNSVCINTLDSFTCVCQSGYYDLSPFLQPACQENALFTQCPGGLAAGGVSKRFLFRYFGGNVTVVFNDGRCSINETDRLYYYNLTGALSRCGGHILVNQTHVELRNTLTVILSGRSSITRRDLQVVWACSYPLALSSSAHVRPTLDWFSSHSVVQVNSSRLLEITMALHSDASFTHSYTGPVELPASQLLFLEVALRSEDSLAYDMSLLLESCWATETADPQEERKAFLLWEGCPNESTFRWHPTDGVPQRKRFSVQMFTMSEVHHIYLHCLARICSQEENCTMDCSEGESRKARRNLPDKLTAIVSAGPVSVIAGKPSNWVAVLILLSVTGGLLGLFVLISLGAHTGQVIAQHYLRHQ
ncbi:hypothetical protein GJAV_G00268880 [Gymnothorax javanicus]|nr:hypothetical protein GJAV_G00268880 [Gymnothorax javanicus]